MWAVSRVNVRDPAEKEKRHGEEVKDEKPPPGAVRV
jgi:hypothetical protein